jgi:predicted transcriptional regulator of viral defense system
MNYIELAEKFKNQELFSLNEIRAIEPDFYRARLNDWQDKGYIHKLVRNYYYFASQDFDERSLFRAANRIYPASYISLQSALSYYGIIPEKPLSITSISTRKTKTFLTPAGRFIYRKMAIKYYCGYGLEGTGSEAFLIATPAKALLDLFYLEASLRDRDGIEGLRLNAGRLFELETKKHILDLAKEFNEERVLDAAREVVKL